MSTDRPDHDDVTRVHQDTDGPRRRRSPLAIASVAAAVLIAGGGGAYFAASSSGDDRNGAPGTGTQEGGDGTPPPLAIDGYTQSDGGDSPGIAPGERDPNGVVYRATEKLPAGPESAPVYRAQGEVASAEVKRLAGALGIDGTPQLKNGSWTVGPTKDGSGPALRVTAGAPGTWTYSGFAPGTDNCPKGAECSVAPPTGGADDAVSEKAAKAAAAPVLKTLGLDDAKIDAGQLMGAVRVVNAAPEVGGLPTYGWSTGIRVGADGKLVGGSGHLKSPAKSDTYPVLTADETLAQLNKAGHGRVGIGGCASAVPLDGQAKRQPCENGTGSAKPRSGTPARPEVPVQGATFGLAVESLSGHQALVPSWLFEVRPKGATESYTITHPAVDPRYLTGAPSPRPSEPDKPGTGTAGRHLISYSADGRSLTVRFWGGVCSTYTASAAETEDKVTVTVTEHKADPKKVCIMIAKELDRTVKLDQPLGDRKVVDTTGATVRQG